MLLINDLNIGIRDFEIIDNVSIGEMGFLETIDLLTGEHKALGSYLFSLKDVPFVEIPANVTIQNNDNGIAIPGVNCILGKINVNTNEKTISPINMGGIEIDSIIINTTTDEYREYRGLYYTDYINLNYRYDFFTKVYDKKGKTIEHVFTGYCYSRIEKSSKKVSCDSWLIELFFKNVVPLIKNYIWMSYPIERLNFAYLDKILPQPGDCCLYMFTDYLAKRNFKNVHPFGFEDALNVIYSMEVIDESDHQAVVFGKEYEPYLNQYILSLINSSLRIQLKNVKESNLYRAEFQYNYNPPKGVSLKNYLLCILFLSLYSNFDSNKANKDFLISMSDEVNEGMRLTKDYIKERPSDYFIRLFDFISDIEVTHMQNGQYRVGKDDQEWKIKTYSFPYKIGFHPNKELLECLNTIIGTKLEFQKETNNSGSLTKEGENSSRFYGVEIYDDDYISGMACKLHDIGSKELRRVTLLKLVDYFVKSYTGYVEFKRYTE